MDDVYDARQMASLISAEFPILADHDGAVTRKYGVYDLLGDGVAAPSAFIIGSDGEVAWRYVGQNISDRPTNDGIMRKLDSLGF